MVPEGSCGRRRPEREPSGDKGQAQRSGVGQIVPGGRNQASRMGEYTASGFHCDKYQVDDESQHEPARSRHRTSQPASSSAMRERTSGRSAGCVSPMQRLLDGTTRKRARPSATI